MSFLPHPGGRGSVQGGWQVARERRSVANSHALNDPDGARGPGRLRQQGLSVCGGLAGPIGRPSKLGLGRAERCVDISGREVYLEEGRENRPGRQRPLRSWRLLRASVCPSV